MAATGLNAQALLATAEAEAGLSDWGDPTFSDRFAQAADLIRATGMDAQGVAAAAENCRWLLSDRLRFFADHERYQLAQEEIVRPLFATGEARSGTTLLHALLATDPNGRALRFWEVMHPSPPPGCVAPNDRRKALADQEWREILDRLPFWLVSHPYNDMLGDGLPEDERTWAFDFRAMTPTAWWRVPMGIFAGGLPLDPRQQYRIHKMMLQAIQHGRPNKYWVLKGFHQDRLATLFETYPDARIVWSHRDPLQVAASRTKLIGELVEGLAGHVDWAEMARQAIAGVRASIAATMADPMVSDPRIHHVRYTDFVADPVKAIHGFYDAAAVPWTAEFEAAMRDYLACNRGDRYGKFTYSTQLLTDIGEKVAALHEEFRPYRERFGVEIEKRD
jgi:hypothetical protein